MNKNALKLMEFITTTNILRKMLTGALETLVKELKKEIFS